MESISLSDMVAVLSFFGTVLFFIIKSFTKPLQDLLQRTIQALNRLSDLLTEEQQRRQELELRIQKVEDGPGAMATGSTSWRSSKSNA